MTERFLRPAEAAQHLAVSPKTIRNWLRKGTLQGVKVGRLWRLRQQDLDDLVLEQPEPLVDIEDSGPSGPGAAPGPGHAPTPLEELALSAKHIHLLRGTYRVMAEKGVKGLSLQHVADEAGVSKGILLYYFGSKENLILTAMRWVLGRVAGRIRTAALHATSAEEKVAAMIDAIFIDPRANRDFYLVFNDLLSSAARLHKFDELSAAFRNIVNAAYEQIIDQGIQQGTFRVTNALEAASVVRAMIDGLFLQWLQEAEWETLHPQLREVCKRAVLGYLRSAPATEAPHATETLQATKASQATGASQPIKAG